jgi:hypothetical protein
MEGRVDVGTGEVQPCGFERDVERRTLLSRFDPHNRSSTMSDDKPRDPQTPPQNDALKTRIDKLGEDIDRLDEEALPHHPEPADIGGALGD